ncbi:MAG: HAMP domain-containing protein [Proteobacteria bacterium]|nr:HAMP domain-containing protein [Pseudomonadota bacterium]
MSRLRAPAGLIGRLVAILLLTVIIEFGISTLLYERASQFSVRDDEARRLAEHLVIVERLISERPFAERPGMAGELTTDRYLIRWSPAEPHSPAIAPALDSMRAQVLAWEPALRTHSVRMWLVSPGRKSAVAGIMGLHDGSWLYFETLQPVTGLNLATERVLLALIPALGLMLIAGLLVRIVLRPLRRLAIAADRVGHGGEAHVPEEGPGEVVTVIRAFNRMQERIHQLIDNRTQALAAVGHDFRTPLARLRLRAEGVDDAETRGAIETDIGEMEAMIESLLAFLGGDSDPEPAVPTDVAILCETLVDDATDRGFDARYDGPVHLEMTVRPIGLKRAVGNLIENALHYGGNAAVTLSETPGGVMIGVADNGPGLPEDKLEEVTKPFVRLDSARPRDTVGFGLGLAIVARAVELEGGTLTLRNRPAGGLSAEIVLRRS